MEMWWADNQGAPAHWKQGKHSPVQCVQPVSQCPTGSVRHLAGHPVSPGIPGGAWRRLETPGVLGGGRRWTASSSRGLNVATACLVHTHFLECRIRYSHSVMVTLRFPCSSGTADTTKQDRRNPSSCAILQDTLHTQARMLSDAAVPRADRLSCRFYLYCLQ